MTAPEDIPNRRSLRPRRCGSAVGTALVLLLVAGLSGAVGSRAASATEWASAWVETMHARARLFAGPRSGAVDGERLVGVQIELDPGWHTYWRSPGDAGFPTRFDWSASGNLAEGRVGWPAPGIIAQSGGTSLGYVGETVFPVAIRPEDPDRPVDLKLQVTYAVCAEICIPAFAELSLRLGRDTEAPGDALALLETHLQRVPILQAEEDPASQPRVLRAWPEVRDKSVSMVVEAAVDGETRLYLEGPRNLYFSVPEPASRQDPGPVRFVVPVSGVRSPADLNGAELRATLVGATRSVEHSWTVE